VRRSTVLAWLTAGLLATAALVAPGAGAQSAPAPPPPAPYFGQGQSWDAGEPAWRVAVYGDSLVRQSTGALAHLASSRSTALDIWATSGAAPCDLLPAYAARLATFAPQRVQIAFVGNATSPCMTSRTGGRPPGRLSLAARARIADLYAADLAQLVDLNVAAGIVTYLVLPPVMAPATWHGQLTPQLTAAYSRLAALRPGWVRLNAAPREAVAPGGAYRAVVPLNGRPVRLRHVDGTHLAAPLGTTLYAQSLLWPLLLEP
jgi:hypothetical protein